MPRGDPHRRFCIGLLVSGLVAGTLHASVIVNEEFDGTALDTSIWSWQNPGGNSTYSVAGGTLNLAIGQGSDQWDGIDRAPRLLRTQSGTTWSIEARIAANTGKASTFAGLALFRDARNWFMWGQVGNAAMEASGFIDGRFTQPVGKMATRFEYVRVRRLGNAYLFDASLDGVHWTNGNVFVDLTGALQGARVGFMAKNWGKKSQYEVRFDFFRVHDADLMPTAIKGVQSTELMTQETGASSFNRTDLVDVCGADLGEMFDWNGKTYIAFGDTGGCAPNAFWRSNTMAFTTDPNPADGLLFDGWITDAQGRAKELFNQDRGAITAIPTSGVGTSTAAYLFYMQVTNWNNWTCNLSSIASATTGNPGVWTKQNQIIQWGPGNFNMVGILKEGPTLYVYGTPCGRYGSVKLMKVDESSVLTKSAYRYFAGYAGGVPVWSPLESAGVTVAGGPAGELSIRFNAWLDRYVMSYLDEPKGLMVVRESPLPWGPWSAPVPIATYTTYPLMYGAFMKAGYEENGGQSFYYMMSLWGPYNTFWMRTTFKP